MKRIMSKHLLHSVVAVSIGAAGVSYASGERPGSDAESRAGVAVAERSAAKGEEGQMPGERSSGRPSGEGGKHADAEIFALLEVANLADTETGQLAQMKGKNRRVQGFGHRMVQDHINMLNDGAGLALHLNVVPEKPAEAKKMMKEHKETLSKLKQKSGAEFDRAYIEHEVMMHERVLDKLEHAMKDAEHDALRQLLKQSRKHVEAHLKDAQDLKRQISS